MLIYLDKEIRGTHMDIISKKSALIYARRVLTIPDMVVRGLPLRSRGRRIGSLAATLHCVRVEPKGRAYAERMSARLSS